MMKFSAMLVGIGALMGTIVPPVLFALNLLSQGSMQAVMLMAAMSWFAAAPFWMKME